MNTTDSPSGPLQRIVGLQRQMPRTLAQVRDEHVPKYRRKRLGYHPITGRTRWGCELECSCGFKVKWNEGKRETDREWREHTREAWIAEKASLQANAALSGCGPTQHQETPRFAPEVRSNA